MAVFTTAIILFVRRLLKPRYSFMVAYRVKLESFEGPLDLLLFLIKKNEVEIYDIPISLITQQYLEYLEIIQLLDLEAASDFILMAATLMRIKAQMLLPKPEMDEEDEELIDPRQELVHRLLEYKRFKDVAEELVEKEKVALESYYRGSFKIEENGFDEEILEASEVTLFDLVDAFRRVLKKKPKVTVHNIQEFNVSLEDRIEYIEKAFEKNEKIKFTDLFRPQDDRIVWIVTFIALLELVKRQAIRALQENPFDEILIVKLHGQTAN